MLFPTSIPDPRDMGMTSPGLGFQAAVTSRAAPRYGEMVGRAFLYSVLVGGRAHLVIVEGGGTVGVTRAGKPIKQTSGSGIFFFKPTDFNFCPPFRSRAGSETRGPSRGGHGLGGPPQGRRRAGEKKQPL